MTELVFILDRSGSMSGLEKDTIGGFNSMLEKQRKEPGDTVIAALVGIVLVVIYKIHRAKNDVVMDMSLVNVGS